MKKQDFFERASTWAKNSIGLKIFSIGMLVLILLVPSSMVKSLIRERENRMATTINEISAKWGTAQTIAGPFIVIPYHTYTTDEEDNTVRVTKRAFFSPDSLDIVGALDPEIRYRGIYDVLLYTAELELTGSFSPPTMEGLDIPDEDILWEKAILALYISDVRGIQDGVSIKWGETDLAPAPGFYGEEQLQAGIHVPLALTADDAEVPSESFSFSLDLRGSKRIDFIPAAKETQLAVSSSWDTPSFCGAFLPDQREITSEGFTAKWKILEFNRVFSHHVIGSPLQMRNVSMGVRLLLAIDAYQKSTRSAKYSLLFIVLTFVTLFLVEIVRRIKVHPFQYLLIGFGLVLFFLLLLSLSEQLSFVLAYVIASASIVVLVTGYARSIVKSMRVTLLIGGIVAVLYAMLYTLLQMEDHALLVGSVMLFVALAAAMYLTRRVNWYTVGSAGED